MRKTLWISALLGVGALMTSACGEPDPCATGICVDAQMPDAGPGDDAGTDGGFTGDAGPCPLLPGQAAGAECAAGDRCVTSGGHMLACEPELVVAFPTGVLRVLPDGGVGTGRPFPIRGMSGGACIETCNPDAQEDTCGDCSTCNADAPQGSLRAFGVGSFVEVTEPNTGMCRPDCVPSETDNGGCREGWTCDVWSGTCVDACVNNQQCEYSIGDPDGDGDGNIVDNGAGSGGTCVATTGRCDIPGTDGAVAGDPCDADSDCEDNGICLQFTDDPGGYCSRIGCRWGGAFACDGDDEVCDLVAFGDETTSACFEGCDIGAETTRGQIVGAGGGNPTCLDAGYMCVTNGTATGSQPNGNGSCLPGNYNDTPAYNVGEPCLDDSECFSPFGGGRCLFLGTATDRVQSGICVIGGCAGGADGEAIGLNGADVVVPLPGAITGAEVCDVGGGDLCVGFGGGQTFCVETCTAASDCAPGYGCLELLTDGTRLCWPNCGADTDCVSGSTCRNTAGAACGADQECYCSNAMPAPIDGGATTTDAGTPDAGTPDAGTTEDAGEADAG